MVPVKMGQKYICADRRAAGFLHQSLTQSAKAAAGVKNYAVIIPGANLNARCVAAEFQVLNLGSRGRTADTPEFESYVDAVH